MGLNSIGHSGRSGSTGTPGRQGGEPYFSIRADAFKHKMVVCIGLLEMPLGPGLLPNHGSTVHVDYAGQIFSPEYETWKFCHGRCCLS
jgi:hypothetical protein